MAEDILAWTEDMPNPTEHMLEAGVHTVVACTGRCGSTYLTQLLINSGLNATHEAFYRPVYFCTYNCKAHLASVQVGMEKPAVVKSDIAISPFLAPYLSELPESVRVIHLVRNPLHVVRSWYKDGFRWGQPFQQWWLNKRMGYEPMWPQVHEPRWYAELYCRWNLMIEELAPCAERLRIEDATERCEELFGVKPAPTPKGINSTRWERDITLGDVSETSIKAFMRRYGYGD